MPTWADVERIALALPNAEETTSYRQRLDAVDDDELAGRIEDSYAFMASKKPARPRKR